MNKLYVPLIDVDFECKKDCINRGNKVVNGKLVSCHYTCEKYLKFRKEIEESKKKKEEENVPYIYYGKGRKRKRC